MVNILAPYTFPIHIQCKNGKKVLHYPKGWADTPVDQLTPPENANALALKTGKESGVTVIDIDSVDALQVVKEQIGVDLLSVCKYIVKTAKGFHFYFKYSDKLKTTTSYRGVHGLDVRNDGANVICEVHEKLSCAKYEVVKTEELVELPEQFYLIKPSFVKAVEPVRERPHYPLALLVNELLSAQFIDGHLHYLTDKAKSALRRLTPMAFRTGEMGEHYRQIFEAKGYLEPNDILDGDGSTYLSRVAAILAADETIDYSMFERTLKHLNRLWAVPMEEERLEKTIIKNGNIIIDGKAVWQYNPNWVEEAEANSQYHTLLDEGIVAFYEPNLDKYIAYVNEQTTYFLSKQGFVQTIMSITGIKFKDWHSLPVYHITFNPKRLERIYNENGITYFNNYKITPLLELAARREKPTKKPEIILKIVENLFPDPVKRELFLHWLGYWWATREKSLVSWVITSPQGAGKGLLTDVIIANVVGQEYSSLEVGEDLLEDKFTSWLENKLFVSFNEINTLTRDRFKNRNKLKRIITGNTFQLRKMQQNPIEYPNYANFIFSTNDSVPVDVEETDRRFNITQGANPLRNYKWFNDIENIVEVILSELPDFVRYVTSMELSKSKYNKVVEDYDLKRDIMLDNLTPLQEFFMAMKEKNIEYFEIELEGRPDYEVLIREIKQWFKDGAPTGRVFELAKSMLPTLWWTRAKFTRELKRYIGNKIIQRRVGEDKVVRTIIW